MRLSIKSNLIPAGYLAACVFSFAAHGAVWHVGATQTYTMPSQVSTLMQNGDTVNIDAGVYASDVAHWTANNLVLRGVNGYASLPSGGLVYGGKAIWVIGGNNTTVEYIDFSQAACPDLNGAGIRQEGLNLVVRRCRFHDNQEGILAGTVNPSNILIEYSEFADNGAGDGYSHNLYINHIDTFTFRYNYSHGALVGHELKSRANVNYILYNRISDEANGTASRSIDLPNGGTSYLIGNVIEQGPMTENSNMVGYGMEGLTNSSPHELYAVNNTLVNNRVGGSFFQMDPATVLFKAYNNVIAGTGSFISGTPPSGLDTASNKASADISSFRFTDAVHYDYGLTDSSFSVLDQGTNAGTANGYSLSPVWEYLHPADATARCTSGVVDIGAFELCVEITSLPELKVEPTVYPNPTSGMVRFNDVEKTVSVVTALGETVFEGKNVASLNLNGLVDGVYILKFSRGSQLLLVRK